MKEFVKVDGCREGICEDWDDGTVDRFIDGTMEGISDGLLNYS